MLYAAAFSAIQVLLIRYIWLRTGVIENGKGRIDLVASFGVGLLAVILNLLLFNRQYEPVKCFNLMMIFVILAMAAGIDYKKYLIPNKLILAGMAGRVLLLAAEAVVNRDAVKYTLLLSCTGLILGLFFMLFLTFITRRGIGYGDVKLFAWLGFSVGIMDAYSILFYSVLFAAVTGVFLLAFHKADRKKKLPFAPFIFAGCYAVFVMSLLQG